MSLGGPCRALPMRSGWSGAIDSPRELPRKPPRALKVDDWLSAACAQRPYGVQLCLGRPATRYAETSPVLRFSSSREGRAADGSMSDRAPSLAARLPATEGDSQLKAELRTASAPLIGTVAWCGRAKAARVFKMRVKCVKSVS